jgi:hypothetical protein
MLRGGTFNYRAQLKENNEEAEAVPYQQAGTMSNVWILPLAAGN